MNAPYGYDWWVGEYFGNGGLNLLSEMNLNWYVKQKILVVPYQL